MRRYDCSKIRDYFFVREAMCQFYKDDCSECPLHHARAEYLDYCDPYSEHFASHLPDMQKWADEHLSISVFDAIIKVLPGLKGKRLFICPCNMDNRHQKKHPECKYSIGSDMCKDCVERFLDSPYTGPAFVDEQED